MGKGKKLTDRQLKFVDEYMIDRNATQAYIRAYGQVKNADKMGPRLVGKSRAVREEIDRRMARETRRAELNAERIMREWGRIALANMRDFVDIVDGQVRIKDMATIDPADSACIQEITCTTSTRRKGDEEVETTVTKIKLADKKGALDSAAKALGVIAPDAIKIPGGKGGPTRVILEWEGDADGTAGDGQRSEG